jgi:hypothetical protein
MKAQPEKLSHSVRSGVSKQVRVHDFRLAAPGEHVGRDASVQQGRTPPPCWLNLSIECREAAAVV